jgi:hypothetical protein
MEFLFRVGLPTLATACFGLLLGTFAWRNSRPVSRAILVTLSAYAINVARSAMGFTVANLGWIGEAIYSAPGAFIFGPLYYWHLKKNWIDDGNLPSVYR